MAEPGLDPEARDLLEVIEAMELPPIHTLSVEDARERMRMMFVSRAEPFQVLHVENRVLPSPGGGLPLRIYRPRDGQLPVALFLHGGGWVLNDLDTHDDLCRRLASRSGWMFAALDYRRAPEFRYPSALEDAYLAYRWLIDNAQQIGAKPGTSPAAVGDSSGATMAAGLTLLLRDVCAPLPSLQLLAYPMTDWPDSWPSYAERGSGFSIDRDLVQWFNRLYLPAQFDRSDPYLVPLAAPDLGGLPPTIIVTAEFDPLRDEGLAYVQRLAEAGVPLWHEHARGQMHGFLLLGRAIPQARTAIDRLGDLLAMHSAEQLTHPSRQQPWAQSGDPGPGFAASAARVADARQEQ